MTLKIFNKSKSSTLLITIYIIQLIGFFLLGLLIYQKSEAYLIVEEINFEAVLLILLSFIATVSIVLILRISLNLIDLAFNYPLLKFVFESEEFNLYDSDTKTFGIKKSEISKIKYSLNRNGISFEIYNVLDSECIGRFDLANNYLLIGVFSNLYEKRNVKLLKEFFCCKIQKHFSYK